MLLLLACSPQPSVPLKETAEADTAGATETADSPVDTEVPVDTNVGEGCGDGVVDGRHEECDGADDSACPGQCASACQCPATAPSGVLSLHMVDIWQGDGLVLESPDGFRMLVDAGDEDHYRDYEAYLAAQGMDSIDYSVVSHQHTDHMGGMDHVLRDHPEIGRCWDSGTSATTADYDYYVNAAGDRRASLQAGDVLDLGPSLQVDVLHADTGDRDNENNNSVVLRVIYGDVRILLGGDCESAQCESAFDPGPIDIYKVHHHGSSDSSGGALLREMTPSVALISVGAGNDYGHPTTSTLYALGNAGAEVWRTDLDGNVVVRTDGQTWTVEGDARE